MEENSPLSITNTIKEDLNATAQWGRFLAILGFIIIGIIFLAVGVAFSIGSSGNVLGGLSVATFMFTYLIVALVYFFPTLYLFNYSNRLRKALKDDLQDQLILAFRNLRKLFVYFGVVTIVTLVFYVLAVIAIAAGGLIGSAMQS